MRIYRRGKFYWAQFQNRRISLRVTDRKAAELAARELQRAASDPTYVPTNETSLGAAFQRFVERQKERGRSKWTLKMYECHAGHWARVLGRDAPLTSVVAKTVDAYVTRRLREGATKSTVGKELSTLRGALKMAARRSEYHRPLEQVMPDGFSIEYEPLDRHLTEQQIPKLLAALTPDRAAVCAFIVATAADWRCVADAVASDFRRDSVLVRGTKNERRWREVPVLGVFRPLVDLARSHVPFRPWGNVRRDIAAACVRAKIPRVTPRDLRRTHSKLLRARGVEPQLIGPMLGHADSRMTERVYGRLSAEALGALVDPKSGTRAVVVPKKLLKGKRRETLQAGSVLVGSGSRKAAKHRVRG